MMFKQVLLCIALTILAILSKNYVHLGMTWLGQGYDGLVYLMGYILKDSYWATIIKEVTAALVLTFGMVAIIGLVYWLVKKAKLANSAVLLWGVWSIIITALLSR